MLFQGMMVNPKLIEGVFQAEPVWEDILSKIWEINEKVDLQEYATFLRTLLNNEFADMRTWWEIHAETHMSAKEEALVFGNPKILAKITALFYFIDYIEGMGKMQNLTNLMGLGKYGPITNNKICRGVRNGGKKRVELMKEEKVKLQKNFVELYQKHKRLAPNLSDSQIYEKIALNHGCSASWVYKIIKDYRSPQKK